MVENPNEIDMTGKKIKEGDRLIVSQYKQSVFFLDSEFKDQKEADDMAELHSVVTKKKMLYRPYGDVYRLYYEDGTPYTMQVQEIISEKNVFYMESENEIPEIGVSKGDRVLCIAGEGYAAGVCRYPSYMLKIK